MCWVSFFCETTLKILHVKSSTTVWLIADNIYTVKARFKRRHAFHKSYSGSLISNWHLPTTDKFSLVFRVGDFLKSTRHLYTPPSASDTLSMVNTAGSEGVRKYDRPSNVSSFQCDLFGSMNLSRISTLK